MERVVKSGICPPADILQCHGGCQFLLREIILFTLNSIQVLFSMDSSEAQIVLQMWVAGKPPSSGPSLSKAPLLRDVSVPWKSSSLLCRLLKQIRRVPGARGEEAIHSTRIHHCAFQARSVRFRFSVAARTTEPRPTGLLQRRTR